MNSHITQSRITWFDMSCSYLDQSVGRNHNQNQAPALLHKWDFFPQIPTFNSGPHIFFHIHRLGILNEMSFLPDIYGLKEVYACRKRRIKFALYLSSHSSKHVLSERLELRSSPLLPEKVCFLTSIFPPRTQEGTWCYVQNAHKLLKTAWDPRYLD